MIQLAHWLNLKIASFADLDCIISGGEKYSYTDLFNRVHEYFLQIREVISSGDVVVIASDYSFESVALFLALLENKNIIVPITTKNKAEIDVRVEEAYTDYILFLNNTELELKTRPSKSKHRLLQKILDAEHAGVILFSSGSTGKPKAMVHDLDVMIENYRDKTQRDTIILVFLMFDHIGGLNTLLNALSMGALTVIPEKRDPSTVCRMVSEYKVDILPASPTFLNLILISQAHRSYDLSSIKLITYGTEPMQDSLLKRLVNEFPGVKFLQTFGTSETGIAKTKSKTIDSLFMKIDDKKHQFKVVNNELWMRSNTQILGYLNASMDNFTDDGWFKTGDLIEQTNDGYLRIIGRTKEQINVGGEKVLPSEVESVLLEMEEIDDCIAYGKSNPIMGMTVVADIVLKQGVDAHGLKKRIRMHCSRKIDRYKIPTKVNIVEKTSYGERFKKLRLR